MADRAAEFVRARVDAWRSGSSESQASVAIALICLIGASFVVSVLAPAWMPLAAYFVWLLLALLLLRFRALIVVAVIDLAAGLGAIAAGSALTPVRGMAMGLFTVAVLLDRKSTRLNSSQ